MRGNDSADIDVADEAITTSGQTMDAEYFLTFRIRLIFA